LHSHDIHMSPYCDLLSQIVFVISLLTIRIQPIPDCNCEFIARRRSMKHDPWFMKHKT
jgi:hypothetical protein